VSSIELFNDNFTTTTGERMLKIGQYVVLNFTDKNMLSSFFTGHGVESRKRSHDYHRDLILPQSFCATSFILLSARYFQHVFLVL